MSELKVVKQSDVLWGHWFTEYYIKSEADKVIADKDAKILALDTEVFKQKHHAKLFFDERNYAETLLRRQKYKRCLAMAKWCGIGAQFQHNIVMQFINPFYIKRAEWLEKWRNRWLKIAEKFKEAK